MVSVRREQKLFKEVKAAVGMTADEQDNAAEDKESKKDESVSKKK